MRKIAIVAWYNDPLDQIKIAIEEFNERGYNAISVDASRILEIINGKSSAFPDIILIWNRHQGMPILPQIRNVFSGKIIFFNWDDPHAVFRSDLLSHVGALDYVFSTCRSTQQFYLQHGATCWDYLPPFYSDKWHYPEFDSAYSHDVAFVCTNLYKDRNNFPGQIISRYDLIKALDSDPNLNFGLYGPPSIRDEFPKSYRGFCQYQDNHKIFGSSKISISTHVENGDGYTNERCITILASKGLLFVDSINGVEDLFDGGCVVMRSSQVGDVVTQIKEILKNYSSYYQVKNKGLEIVKKYRISEWASKILAVVT